MRGREARARRSPVEGRRGASAEERGAANAERATARVTETGRFGFVDAQDAFKRPNASSAPDAAEATHGTRGRSTRARAEIKIDPHHGSTLTWPGEKLTSSLLPFAPSADVMFALTSPALATQKAALGGRGLRSSKRAAASSRRAVAVAPKAKLYDNILETIGQTPIVKINRLAPEGINLYAKAEFFNPCSSVKDRYARATTPRGARTRPDASRSAPPRRRADRRPESSSGESAPKKRGGHFSPPPTRVDR